MNFEGREQFNIRDEKEPDKYVFGQLQVRWYGAGGIIGVPASAELEAYNPELAKRLDPNRRYEMDTDTFIHIAAIDIDGGGEFSKELIKEGGSVSQASANLVRELTSGLKQIADYIRTHPDSWLAHTDYFFGNSRLASVDKRIAERFGFKTFSFDDPDMGKDTQSHTYATRSYMASGMSEDEARAKANERVSKTAIISREDLLKLY